MVVLVGGGYLLYDRFIRKVPLPEGLIQANGRIEGDHIFVTAKFPGRVTELPTRDGDLVTAGQVVARLDDAQIRAQVEQARQTVLVLEAQIQSAQTALDVFRKEVPLQIATAEADVAHSDAKIAEAKATIAEREIELRRLRRADEASAASADEVERAELALTVAQQELAVAQANLRQAENKLADAKLGWDRVEVQKAEIESQKAQRDRANAVLAEAESILEDMTLRSPDDATVTTRISELGEVVPAGGPVFELVNLDELYLKVYVPEAEIGRLRLGLKARVYTDAFPDQPFDATLRYIASRAEFTPKEVQTPDERVKLVFAVKLYLDANPDHRLTPGMPADAVIRWKEDMPWAKPRW